LLGINACLFLLCLLLGSSFALAQDQSADTQTESNTDTDTPAADNDAVAPQDTEAARRVRRLGD
jgi:hypothetical protein